MGDPESSVMEGFICPICKKDYFFSEELLSHFEEQHAEQDFVKSFKDLFGKAKKKLLKQNGSPEKSNQVQPDSLFNTSFEYEVNYDIGWYCNHTQIFEKLRRDRVERLSLPTNQLIIRLNKLLDNMPSDLIKKKAWEQSVVSWVDGTTVNRCPDCTGMFHLARRKHHCRTCGGIMCKNCSHFLSLNTARKIVDKEVETSENSQNSPELYLRLCIHCISLLESRARKKELAETFPILGQVYNLLVEARTEAEQHLTTYLRMYDSLEAGESKHNLKDAQLLRVRLIKLAESIDSISDKFRALGVKEEGTVEGKLCAGIRTASTNFLCSKLLSLPNLPTEEQLRIKQERRSEKVQKELERKRLSDMKQRQPSIVTSDVQTTPNGTPEQQQMVSVGQGWVPIERENKVNEEDDPIIQQMQIIRSYIKQAQLAGRVDEVVSLEHNLQELKMEFWSKHAQDDVSRLSESNDDFSYSPDNPTSSNVG